MTDGHIYELADNYIYELTESKSYSKQQMGTTGTALQFLYLPTTTIIPATDPSNESRHWDKNKYVMR